MAGNKDTAEPQTRGRRSGGRVITTMDMPWAAEGTVMRVEAQGDETVLLTYWAEDNALVDGAITRKQLPRTISVPRAEYESGTKTTRKALPSG